MRQASAQIPIIAVVGAWLVVSTTSSQHARAEVPQRSAGGTTLRIPENHMDLGEIYFVQPGQDAQVVITSTTSLQRLTVTTDTVAGYAISPFDLEEGKSPLLAGAMRIPIASLRTGVAEIDDALSKTILDRTDHPEVLISLKEVKQLHHAVHRCQPSL